MTSTVKNEFLKRLFEANGEPVSGQGIADEFGVSRTAIWKYVKEFEEAGYEIGSIRKKGYYLISTPDSLTAANIHKHLQTERYGRTVRYLETCDSTQPIAHQLVQDGTPDGTIVVAEEQVGGKGRMSRPWVSQAYKGIWMSVILKPELSPQQAPQITLVAAVAIVQAIEEVTGLVAQIKWPNDLLINGKKVTGILTELQADPDQVKAIILGIGLNANHDQSEFPEELKSIATSLKVESGVHVNRAELVAVILKYVEQYVALYVEKGFLPIKQLWEKYANTIGKHVRAVMPRETIEGTAVGITEEGMLELKLVDGTIRKIYSGDIEFNE